MRTSWINTSLEQSSSHKEKITTLISGMHKETSHQGPLVEIAGRHI